MTHCVNVTVLLNGRVKPHSYLGLTSTTKLFHFRLIIRLGNYKCIKSALQENIIPRNPISSKVNTIPSLHFPSAPVSQNCGFLLVS